jgi:hypothetical protein
LATLEEVESANIAKSDFMSDMLKRDQADTIISFKNMMLASAG